MPEQIVFDALVEPRRRQILRLIRSEEMASTAIAARFPDVSRPTISAHLQVLRKSSLVTERRGGTRRLYRVRHEGFADLHEFLDEFWADRLLVLKGAVGAEFRHG